MQIQLIETKVASLFLESLDGGVKDSHSLSFSDGYADDDKFSFVISFDLKIESTQGFKLDINFLALFNTDEEVDEKFKGNSFTSINAPAIAYPYLRSFISTLTVNAGYQAVLLPTVNFQALAKKRKEESAIST